MSRPKHVLVIRLSAMGDVAMTLPILRILATTYPDLKITVLSRPFLKPLFVGIPNLGFLEADVYGKHKGLGLITLAEEARSLGVDAVADLHNVIRSKVITNYLKWKGLPTAKIDKGRAEKKALINPSNKNRMVQLKTTTQRYADVFEKLGFPVDLANYIPLEKKRLIPKLNALIGVEPKKIIGIAPFAAHKSKMYPLELMEKVIVHLDASDKYRIFLFGGGKKEIEKLQKLEYSFQNVSSVAGKLSFEEELILISNLDLMVSMDSGNGHLAANFGIPVLSLWGVTHPFAGFAPFNQPERYQLTSDREKYPLIPTSVYGNKYPKGYETAMETIPPEIILEKIKEILKIKTQRI